MCSNEASTRQRRLKIDGNAIVVYKPVTKITDENKIALQFLDLMSVIDKYSGVTGKELVNKLRKYVNQVGLDFNLVKKYISLFPDRVYRNIYEGGLMSELV